MKMDPKRIEAIVSSYISNCFFYNTIIDVDELYCLSFTNSNSYIERSLDEFVKLAGDLVHPLFISRLKTDMDVDNLKRAYADGRTIRVELLMLGYYDKEYHWYRLRLVPVDDESGHAVFFFNMILVDDDIMKKEKTNDDLFNKTVLAQLIYNYILVYVIDLSNGLSRLVHTNGDGDYEEYASQFDSHIELMEDLAKNYVSEDFVAPFSRFMDYSYLKNQFDGGKDRLVFIFRDKKGKAFEMTISKFPEYAEDYPLITFAIKEIN